MPAAKGRPARRRRGWKPPGEAAAVIKQESSAALTEILAAPPRDFHIPEGAIQLPAHGWRCRPYQDRFWRYMLGDDLQGDGRKKFAVLNFHRRAGKDAMLMNLIAVLTTRRRGMYWHGFPLLNQARRAIWEGFMNSASKKMLDYLPSKLREDQNQQELRINLSTGSTYQLVGGDSADKLTGSGPIGAGFSEYAQMNPAIWDFCSPMMGENDGWVVFISTPRGKNHFYDIYNYAANTPGCFAETLTVEDTWYIDNEGKKRPVITQEYLNGLRKQGKSEEFIRQEFYCFPAGTLIHTSHGQKEIERVQIGDVVMSHSGRFRRVDKLFQRETTEPMVRISSYGNFRDLICTPNHPVRTLNRTNQTYEWTEAGNVKEGDFIVMPKRQIGAKFSSEALAIILAWYVCEGSCSKGAVQFTLHNEEVAEIATVEGCLNRIGISSKRYKAGSTTNIVAASGALADLVATECGLTSCNKRIPWAVISGHEEIFFRQLMLGDGCKTDQGHAYTTTSISLAHDVQLLAHTLGYVAGITKIRSSGECVIEGRIVQYKNCYQVGINTNSSKKCLIVSSKHSAAGRVHSVTSEPFSGIVYNFSVAVENSYIANGRSVHNCDWNSAVEGAVYSRELLRCEGENRYGEFPYDPRYPVHTAWDLGARDMTVIVMFQLPPDESIRVIDMHFGTGKGMPEYARDIRSMPYKWGTHFGPWDVTNRSLHYANSVMDVAAEHGIRFQRLKRSTVNDGIEGVRAAFPRFRFDKARCSKLWNALKAYSYAYDEKQQQFGTEPVHDYSSHFADAIRYLCQSLPRNRGALTHYQTFNAQKPKEPDWDVLDPTELYYA